MMGRDDSRAAQYSTTYGEHTAVWKVVRATLLPEIESLITHTADTPAYRMRMDGSVVDVPDGAPGHVLLGDSRTKPDLALAREWFPKHARLWDAVKAEYWQVVSGRRR